VRQEGITGSGLGLSIARGLVEMHGGTISAEQREGGGTIVRIRLPVEVGAPSTETRRDGRGTEASARSGR
jgi:signal transduction histidine kinase